MEKTLFEKFLPAFAEPTDQTARALAPFIDEAQKEIEEQVGTTAEQAGEPLLRAAALRAAYNALPQLDLVLTPTGFGVVSNQNLAPASKERVAALREQLRKDKCTSLEALLRALVKDFDWQTSPRAITLPRSLFWLPSTFRAHGLRYQGRECYDEEIQALRPLVYRAEQRAAAIISPELHEILVKRQVLNPDDLDSRYFLMQNAARNMIAGLVGAEQGRFPLSIKDQMEQTLLEKLQRYGKDLPEYQGTSTYEAQNEKPYENKKDDTCFFFG